MVLVIAVGALVWVKFDSLTAIVTAPKDIFAQAEALLKDSAAAENNHTARVRFIGKALQELASETSKLPAESPAPGGVAASSPPSADGKSP